MDYPAKKGILTVLNASDGLEQPIMDGSSGKTSAIGSLEQSAINTIRFLAVDAVQKANSGHPGLPLGAAPMAYVLWTRFLRHNPVDPQWFDRDRFVLSAGHGSMLLYALLHLTGYELPLEQLKQFRQWGSLTPGHPERGLTPGVETTTGPLGQGFGNAVGLAMAEAHLAARYNRPGHDIIDHVTYTLASDGDLMEGVAAEAASLAGHLGWGKLISLYDDNHISLAASTQLAFTEDRAQRFEAYGWHTQPVEDGNDLEAIDRALGAARKETGRPSLILVRTEIGYGWPPEAGHFCRSRLTSRCGRSRLDETEPWLARGTALPGAPRGGTALPPGHPAGGQGRGRMEREAGPLRNPVP